MADSTAANLDPSPSAAAAALGSPAADAGRPTEASAAAPSRRSEGGDAAPDPVLGYQSGGDRRAGRRSAVRRLALSAGRWLRDYFALDRVRAFSKSLLWVAPLTVLIWVYAERQQQYEQPGVVLTVDVVSGDPNTYALLQRPSDRKLVVTLKGPRGAVDAAVEQSRMQGASNPIQIRADRTGQDGEQTLTIPTARIAQDKRFADVGISIVAAQPESLTVRLEPMVEWMVPVQPRDRQRFPNVEFTPPQVRVRGPASLVGDPRDPRDPRTKAIVYADLADRPELAAAPDRDVVLDNVRLSLWVIDPSVTFVPAQPTDVKAKVRPAGTARYEIRAVPLKLVVSSQIARDFTVDEPVPLHNVWVTGPKEKIDKLEAQVPAALADLTASDAPTQTGKYVVPVRFQFEPGITVEKEPWTVEVNLTKRGE